jgi:hypothetical protein
MREAEEKLIQESFSSVMPYLVYPQDLRALIERLLKESQSVKEFQEKIKQVISAEADSTRKTDGQIFLNELRRHMAA